MTNSATVVNRVVNTSLTVRNWVIGAYIVEYELSGADRAEYGNRIIENLAVALRKHQVPTCDPSRLYAYAAFFRAYPQIQAVAAQTWPQPLPPSLKISEDIFRSLTGKLQPGQGDPPILRSVTEELGVAEDEVPEHGKVRTASAQFAVAGDKLLSSLTYTHFEQLVAIENPLKRSFYEIECIRGNWSVRALKRQISSLYFERSGLSLDKDKLSARANDLAEQAEPKLAIRDPYIFEFLGLKPKESVAESDLEQALLDHLQEFLLELGHGFAWKRGRRASLSARRVGSWTWCFTTAS